MSDQNSNFDKLAINWLFIDSFLIDKLISALNQNTQLTLHYCNSLSEADVDILENLLQFLYRADIKERSKKENCLLYIEDYSERIYLVFYALNEFENGTFNDLGLVLRLISSFSKLLNQNKVIIQIWNTMFQNFQLFSIAKGNMNYIIQLKNWWIKLSQNKSKSNNLSKTIDLQNWKIERKSVILLYKQLLKILGENNYRAIYRLKNFIIANESSKEINMLDDLWNKINKRYLVYNLLLFEITAIIKEIGILNYEIQTKI